MGVAGELATGSHEHEFRPENYRHAPCPGCGCIVLTFADNCRFRRNGEPHLCGQPVANGPTIMDVFIDSVR